MKEIFSDSIHRIETHIDVVIEVIDINISVSFEVCLDEELKAFWWDGIMFDVPHATNFGIVSPFQWLVIPVNQYHGDKGPEDSMYPSGLVRISNC